jgi:ribosome-associated heat shock protein Hsp15
VAGGGVRVNRVRVTETSRLLREGDVLTIRLPREVKVVRVLGFADRRVSPSLSRLLYESLGAE